MNKSHYISGKLYVLTPGRKDIPEDLKSNYGKFNSLAPQSELHNFYSLFFFNTKEVELFNNHLTPFMFIKPHEIYPEDESFYKTVVLEFLVFNKSCFLREDYLTSMYWDITLKEFKETS